ncbi:hypothetical protein GCM10009827_063960 [Dactylosporangium maewongense]|uniref:LysR substrate-binding domain-containing protein n=1 Tax=Dactylosporangium maewongense TaxID=634393 RepID=A0ABN2B9E5_9ACTN
MHGELWLTSTGLMRRRLSLEATRAHGLGPTVAEPLERADIAAFDLDRLLAEHPTNKVIAFSDVAHARLVRGVTAHGLRLRMIDGRRHKLLWLTRDPAYQVLSTALAATLGQRLHRSGAGV